MRQHTSSKYGKSSTGRNWLSSTGRSRQRSTRSRQRSPRDGRVPQWRTSGLSKRMPAPSARGGLGTPESSAHRTHHGESQRSGGAPGGSGQNPSVPDPQQCGHGWSSFKVVSFGASDVVVLPSGSVPGWVRLREESREPVDVNCLQQGQARRAGHGSLLQRWPHLFCKWQEDNSMFSVVFVSSRGKVRGLMLWELMYESVRSTLSQKMKSLGYQRLCATRRSGSCRTTLWKAPCF